MRRRHTFASLVMLTNYLTIRRMKVIWIVYEFQFLPGNKHSQCSKNQPINCVRQIVAVYYEIRTVIVCWSRPNYRHHYLKEYPPPALRTTLWHTYSFIHSLLFSLEGRAWQEPEPSRVTDMGLAHCILGKFLGVVCHCFPPPLDVPTSAARCLRTQRRERS